MIRKNMVKKAWLAYTAFILILIGVTMYYVYFFTPKNSLELYQQLTFAKDFEEVQKHILDGYDDYFLEEDFNYFKNNSAKWIGQFSIFEYSDKSYIVMTSPGTARLKILSVEELPNEMREFFLGVSEKIIKD